MNNNVLLISLIFFIFTLFGTNVYAEESPIAPLEYYEHIYKIGLIEEYAGNLLSEYADDIESLSVPDVGMTRLENTLANFENVLEEHLSINPPTKHQKFHDLLTLILKSHTRVFKGVVTGLLTKDPDLIDEVLTKYAEGNIDETKNELMSVMKQLSKETDEYVIRYIEEKIGREVERNLNEKQ